MLSQLENNLLSIHSVSTTIKLESFDLVFKIVSDQESSSSPEIYECFGSQRCLLNFSIKVVKSIEVKLDQWHLSNPYSHSLEVEGLFILALFLWLLHTFEEHCNELVLKHVFYFELQECLKCPLHLKWTLEEAQALELLEYILITAQVKANFAYWPNFYVTNMQKE